MAMEPQDLEGFISEQKNRYGDLFWYEKQGKRIVFMLEQIASKARDVLKSSDIAGQDIVSFEMSGDIGAWYAVAADQVDIEQRPDREEYQSIMDKDLGRPFTDLTNDIYQDQLIRVYQPNGYDAWCVVAYHSFGDKAPYGPIGWVKDLQGFRSTKGMIFNQPLVFFSLEESQGKFLGLPYRLGGGSFKNGFDCSSLVQRIIYETRGFWLPRKARWQSLVCDRLELSQIVVGDLVFFNRKDNPAKEIDHVALVHETHGSQLPSVFHAKRINGCVQVDDLRSVSWLDTPPGQVGWEINGFGRIRKP